MQEVNKLINAVFEISLNNLNTEDNWETVSINACVLNKMVEIIAFHAEDEKQEYFNPKKQGQNSRDEYLTFLFKDLKGRNVCAISRKRGLVYCLFYSSK